jgi:transcription elongation factor Elf1
MNEDYLNGGGVVLRKEPFGDKAGKYYFVRHKCLNCRQEDLVYIKKGFAINKVNIVCSNCGCSSKE